MPRKSKNATRADENNVAPITTSTVDEEAKIAALLEAQDAQAEVEDQATEPAAADEGEVTLAELVDAVDTATRETKSKAVIASFDDRMAFEKKKNPDNASIQKTLVKTKSALGNLNAAALLVATNVSADFMNAQQHTGSGYNVYAIDKLADIVNGLNGGVMRNAINNAIARSLFKFRAAGETFTGEMARAAASDKLRVQGQIAKLLVRHTVSASTAPTQASSTMQALQTLGIVVNKGSVKHPVYELTDTPQTRALEQVLAA